MPQDNHIYAAIAPAPPIIQRERRLAPILLAALVCTYSAYDNYAAGVKFAETASKAAGDFSISAPLVFAFALTVYKNSDRICAAAQIAYNHVTSWLPNFFQSVPAQPAQAAPAQNQQNIHQGP